MADLSLVTANKLNVVEHGEQLTLPAGYAATAGDLVYIDSNGKWQKADANAQDANIPLFLLHATKAAGYAVTGSRYAIVDGFDLSALAFNDVLYLSTTAGKVATKTLGINEVQTLTISGTPTGGTYTITFRGDTTTALAHNANAAAIQAALEALPSIGSGNVAVTGTYVITFTGALRGQQLPLAVGDGALLTGGTSPAATIVETTSGQTNRRVGFVIPGVNTTLGTSPDKLLLVDMR